MEFEMMMMDSSSLLSEDETLHHQSWTMDSIAETFLKCTRWQLEETLDLLSCPYHYFCDSSHDENYPPIVDYSVLLFAVACFVSLAFFTVSDFRINAAGASKPKMKRRYWLPSGPLALPLVLLILAKGNKINTAVPLTQFGPMLLLLVQISALAFRNQTDKYITYAVLESSTISAILHASMYLDFIILPFYTGLDAFNHSRFSGECPSCVCRTDALVVGGKMILYRGWSRTMMVLVSTLCSRILCEIFQGERLILIIKSVLEGISWVFIASDATYLLVVTPQRGASIVAAYGGICILILLNVLRKARSLFASKAKKSQTQLAVGLRNVDTDIV